jgi:nitrate/TMAO reductase-like tetraheme cytochrome c subunit
MKRMMLVVLFALLAVSLAVGQNFIPNTDVLGAHNNGGRGCAACHAPHSGGRGSGGSIVAGSGVSSLGGNEGDYHLWGQDVSLITQETLQVGGGFNTGGAGFTVNFGGGQQWTSTSLPVISGIAVCLSCHDGNVSKGAMMMNQSYEQAWGLLPSGGSQHATNGPLYGTAPIPTLLGNDGGTVGDYLNDHPVGPNANVNGLDFPKALSAYGLNYTVNGTAITWTTSGQYATFVSNYGAPSVNGMVVDATNQVPYVVCTTCHNQHQMNVFAAGRGLSAIQGSTSGTYATYFFVNAPYNPGAAWTPTAAPSTTQFCRQCHFGVANEAYGVTAVTTAF